MPEAIPLWNNRQIKSDQKPPSITPYLLEGDTPRPAILVIPGGGYRNVCESTEGYAIARRFNELGFHAAVLHYRVFPHHFPEPQQDAFRAIKILRGNAREWKIIPNQIATCGFSAGGHLSASTGTLQDENIDATDKDRYDDIDQYPDAIMMAYPVISLEAWSHGGSGHSLLGDEFDAKHKQYSLENRVSDKTPPTFLWATLQDKLVSYKNSVVFAQAMAEHNRPCELHIFPFGAHGMLLGINTFDVGQWTTLAANFLKTHFTRQELQDNPEKLKQFDELYTNAMQAKLEPPR
ncbi:MAG: alpha/beta hydrolase [Lentisphaerae bacterium]|jgi:acetyl esterase/lipase|nr:alpha/beta hydrolase [Lentisphaerota bacterium]